MSFRSIVIILLFINCSFSSSGQVEDLYLSNRTPEYQEVIAFYKSLEKEFDEAKLIEYSRSDAGPPIHLFVLDATKRFSPKDGRTMLLVMNAIHAGEPCGVDASMNFVKELLSKGQVPENILIGIIPIYNVGGALNRNSFSRTNQDGPEEHGFRGNAKNLDLNRDFIKNDSKNALAFTKLFSEWKPEIFIDTHTSNGADYQYPFTLIASQKDKLNPTVSDFMYENFIPFLFNGMKESGMEMVPYVNVFGRSPDSGINAFMDYPRYSTGYAALFNTMAFTTEAHMLKPYQLRVKSTLEFLKLAMEYCDKNATLIAKNKAIADKNIGEHEYFDLNWSLNDSIYHLIEFKGYTAEYKDSDVSGLPRLYYDHSKPFTDSIVYRDTFDPTVSVKKPKFYIVPQAWDGVVERLKNNGVKMETIPADTVMKLKVYYIKDYETSKKVYEGHYFHSNVSIEEKEDDIKLWEGDYLVPMGYATDYFVVSVLDPRGVDSYFTWNFFDAILQQKEWFSSYVFEDEASEILKENPELSKELEKKKANDEAFKESASAQLYFIYQHSVHYEKEHMRYPIFRMEK